MITRLDIKLAAWRSEKDQITKTSHAKTSPQHLHKLSFDTPSSNLVYTAYTYHVRRILNHNLLRFSFCWLNPDCAEPPTAQLIHYGRMLRPKQRGFLHPYIVCFTFMPESRMNCTRPACASLATHLSLHMPPKASSSTAVTA